MERLEQILRSHKISGPGFLGTDERPLEEIIEADAAALYRAGKSVEEVVQRMREITEAARAGLETTVDINENLQARIIDSRGLIPCPWPHPGSYGKAVTIAARLDTGKSIRWSELNIHMIEAHEFFEGRGSYFRIDPELLVEIIF